MGHHRYLEYSTGEKKIQTKNARTSNNKMQLDSKNPTFSILARRTEITQTA